jgi:competence protein ComEC
VLKIESAALSVLLPGDIERRSEKALVAARPDALRADILLAPHQGSSSSSSPGFVAAVCARAVIFPVGYRNRFGHPRADVLTRYAESGAGVYRTDRDGALLIEAAPGSPVRIMPYRAIRRRYWQSASQAEPVAGPGQL